MRIQKFVWLKVQVCYPIKDFTEEVMDFSLEHLEIESDTRLKTSQSEISAPSQFQVLDDLYKQIDDLQDKLKLNYRKLMLFEAENEKLNQEKNKLFFESKSHAEQNELLIGKLNSLEFAYNKIEEDLQFKNQKVETLEKLSATQAVDLKRLTKFYDKIQNIIKPHVQGLKDQIQSQKNEIESYQKSTFALQSLNSEAVQKIDELKAELIKTQNQYKAEKNNFIQSYEEQIHFLSKEIVSHQENIQLLQSEIFRLKKMTENKHFIENELVRFKRESSEQLQTISELKLRLNNSQNELLKNQESQSQLTTQLGHLEVLQNQTAENLEATRRQLSAKIDEVDQLNLRLKMLEKLNTSLSQSTTTSQNS